MRDNRRNQTHTVGILIAILGTVAVCFAVGVVAVVREVASWF